MSNWKNYGTTPSKSLGLLYSLSYSIHKRTYLENSVPIFILFKILSLLCRRKVMENSSLLPICWNGIMERPSYWYVTSLRILTNIYTKALTTKQVQRKKLFPPCLIKHNPLLKINVTYTKRKAESSICYRRMDLRKALWVKSLRELLQTTACPNHKSEWKPHISKK